MEWLSLLFELCWESFSQGQCAWWLVWCVRPCGGPGGRAGPREPCEALDILRVDSAECAGCQRVMGSSSSVMDVMLGETILSKSCTGRVPSPRVGCLLFPGEQKEKRTVEYCS